ncbi:hypothetical protein BFJ72_g8754 [Fusarium proliferatum]|uniref:Myb-like DNA-binding domain-containing protein n=1 Tax=Gibberella intermedia TaxID=948311 RepID=A0A420T249_GIBIN|nr:hypothetical protein BFJ72_g8754 [Fusarium proliferatum]
MSKQEPADQVKFLVSCIGHTSNGRAVAEELNIVSKAAAQKRYERMLKAHGISRPGALANGNGADSAPSTPKRKAKAEGAGSAKKRATPRKAKKEESEDDEDVKPKTPTSKSKVKKEEEKESADSTGSLSDVPASDGS